MWGSGRGSPERLVQTAGPRCEAHQSRVLSLRDDVDTEGPRGPRMLRFLCDKSLPKGTPALAVGPPPPGSLRVGVGERAGAARAAIHIIPPLSSFQVEMSQSQIHPQPPTHPTAGSQQMGLPGKNPLKKSHGPMLTPQRWLGQPEGDLGGSWGCMSPG